MEESNIEASFWNSNLKVEYSDKTSFWAELFVIFQISLEIFCGLYEHVRGIWNVCQNLIFASGKSYDRTIHKSDYMSGKVKKVEILKKWSSKFLNSRKTGKFVGLTINTQTLRVTRIGTTGTMTLIFQGHNPHDKVTSHTKFHLHISRCGWATNSRFGISN